MGIIFENGVGIGIIPEIIDTILLIENGDVLTAENGNILLFD